MARKSILDKYPVSPDFMAARKNAFDCPKEAMLKEVPKGFRTYAVIVDAPVSHDGLVTVAAFGNGAASMYYNMGGGFVGASAKYKRVAQAARGLVVTAEKSLELAEKISFFDLPTVGMHFVYILTSEGVMRVVTSEKLVAANPKLAALFRAYQSLTGELNHAKTLEIQERNNKEAGTTS